MSHQCSDGGVLCDARRAPTVGTAGHGPRLPARRMTEGAAAVWARRATPWLSSVGATSSGRSPTKNPARAGHATLGSLAGLSPLARAGTLAVAARLPGASLPVAPLWIAHMRLSTTLYLDGVDAVAAGAGFQRGHALGTDGRSSSPLPPAMGKSGQHGAWRMGTSSGCHDSRARRRDAGGPTPPPPSGCGKGERAERRERCRGCS